MSQNPIGRFATVVSTLFVALAVLLPSLAVAQAPAQQAQAQKLVQEYRGAAQELQQIRDEAVKSNPELAEQRKQFEKKLQQAMADSGYDMEASRKKLEKLGQKFQNEDLDEKKRQELAGEFQAERQKMQQAQSKAMQQEDVRKAGEKLQADTLAAMKKQDPRTDKLLKRMDNLRQELQAMRPGAGQ